MSKTTSRVSISAEHCTKDAAPDTRTADIDEQVVRTQDCEACQSTAETGSWVKSIPQGFTHCRDCHVTYPSSNRWGHCSVCHQTFSGSTAFDLHQRVGRDGDIAPDCLCSVVRPGTGEAATYGAPCQRRWVVSDSRTLVSEFGAWGPYWTLASDLSDVFRDGAA